MDTGVEVSLLQPPSPVKTLKRLFVIPHLREGLTFPIGSWSTSSGALCPLFISCGLLSWNGTKLAGVYRNSRGNSGTANQGFSDGRTAALWDCHRLRRLVDHLITYIYKGNGSMKIIIFEASGRVPTFPRLCSTHGQRLRNSNITGCSGWRGAVWIHASAVCIIEKDECSPFTPYFLLY